MSCLDAATLLALARDPAADADALVHLESCANCARELARLERDLDILQEAATAGPGCPSGATLLAAERDGSEHPHVETCPACSTALKQLRAWDDDPEEQARFETGDIEGLSAELPAELKKALAARRAAASPQGGVGSASTSLPRAAMPEDLVHEDDEPEGEDSDT